MTAPTSQKGHALLATKYLLRGVLIVLTAASLYTLWQLWDIHHFGKRDMGASADCAIVLGAAAWYKNPSPVFRARLDHAVELYEQGRVQSLILTGGYGKGAEYSESQVAYEYCLEKGVPSRSLFLETRSTSTDENLLEAKRIFDREHFQSALIVSDPWHLKRACEIAEKYGLAALPSATRTSQFRTPSSKLKFIWKEFQALHLWKIEQL